MDLGALLNSPDEPWSNILNVSHGDYLEAAEVAISQRCRRYTCVSNPRRNRNTNTNHDGRLVCKWTEATSSVVDVLHFISCSHQDTRSTSIAGMHAGGSGRGRMLTEAFVRGEGEHSSVWGRITKVRGGGSVLVGALIRRVGR